MNKTVDTQAIERRVELEAENARLRAENERLRKAALALYMKITSEPYRVTARTFGDQGEAWRLINELRDALGVR